MKFMFETCLLDKRELEHIEEMAFLEESFFWDLAIRRYVGE